MQGTVFFALPAETKLNRLHPIPAPSWDDVAIVGRCPMTVSVLTITSVILVLAGGLVAFRAIPGVRAYFKFRGKRLVTCPETHKAAAVDIGGGEAALGAFLKEPTLRLVECSRWPERENCGQECLQQIEVAPESCLVWNLVTTWYDGKNCVFCHKPIRPLQHL